ncbi:MAG TPA: hypothetical protein VH352_25235 [Pseudonocardiaceae bacterium]|jgi:hypothetical protein|nr:hypothetical protein [Pseudonocardiaceae bacterium]
MLAADADDAEPDLTEEIGEGFKSRLTDAGVDITVTTWAGLLGWLTTSRSFGELLRVLRITRDHKGVRALFEAHIVPLLCDCAEQGEPVDLRGAAPTSLGSRLADQGLAELLDIETWDDLLEFDIEDLDVPARAGVQPAEWLQAKVLIDAATSESTTRVGSRMLHGCAKLGLEIQDLGSAAVQCINPLHTQMLALKATQVLTRHCGTNGSWRLITDGANLEYVLAESAFFFDLWQAFAEIKTVHDWLKTTKPGIYQIGEEVLVICERDVSGKTLVTDDLQLQFNVEMPLDLLCDFVLTLDPGWPLYQDCFSVDNYFWTTDRTDRELAAYRKLAAGVETLALTGLVNQEITDDTDAQRQVRGLLLLLGMCAVHRADYATDPTKDMPILCKTNPISLITCLADQGLLADPGLDDHYVQLRKVLTPLLATLIGATKTKTQLDFIATVYRTGEHPVGCHVDIGPFALKLASTRWTSKRRRYQVLLELRRAPLHNIDGCLDAAQRVFNYFVVDLGGQFI